MATLPAELSELVGSRPMAHVTTLNADGSPQVSVVWIGLDGDDLVTGHLHHGVKLRNLERDPRAVLSMDAPREPGVFLNRTRSSTPLRRSSRPIRRGTCWTASRRSTSGRRRRSPAPERPGYVIRYRVERIGGVGHWVPTGS